MSQMFKVFLNEFHQLLLAGCLKLASQMTLFKPALKMIQCKLYSEHLFYVLICIYLFKRNKKKDDPMYPRENKLEFQKALDYNYILP